MDLIHGNTYLTHKKVAQTKNLMENYDKDPFSLKQCLYDNNAGT